MAIWLWALSRPGSFGDLLHRVAAFRFLHSLAHVCLVIELSLDIAHAHHAAFLGHDADHALAKRNFERRGRNPRNRGLAVRTNLASSGWAVSRIMQCSNPSTESIAARIVSRILSSSSVATISEEICRIIFYFFGFTRQLGIEVVDDLLVLQDLVTHRQLAGFL